MKSHKQTQDRLGAKFGSDHFYVTGNLEAKATIIFIPGGPGLGFEYLSENFEGLGSSFRIAFYNPGFTKNFSSVTLSKLADELQQIQEEFGAKVGFVAHSGGSFILLEYIKKYRSQLPAAFISGIADLSWIDSFHQENENSQQSATDLIQKLKNVKNPEEALKLRMLHYVQDYFPEETQEVGRLLLDRNSYFPTVTSCIEYELKNGTDLRETFCTAKGPFLMLSGQKDRVVFPSYSMKLATERSGPTIQRIVENSGHFGFVDNNDLFNSNLANFFIEKLF